MIHELKLCSTVAYAVYIGAKTFEYRKNDRNFHVGDSLVLKVWDTEKGEYIPDWRCVGKIYRRVTFIVHGPAFGIPEGYCIMSIK